MNPRFAIVAATAGIVAAGLAGCAKAPGPSTLPSATGPAPQMAWQTDDVGAPTGGPPVSDLAGYVFEAQGTQHVIYESQPDNHIHELWWDTAGRHTDDLTAATGAPPADGGDLVGYVFKAQGTQHVIYESAPDHHIHELWWDATGWHTDDLTAATGASPADDFGPLTAYAFDAQGTQHVIYSDANYSDRHIHELWWDATGWHTDDLTAATGAPHDIGDLVAYVFAAQGTQHVIYEGVSDNHVHELWSDASGWHTDDLTAASGAPPVAGPLAGYAFEAQGTQHVIFVGLSDKHIHELWSDPAGWHTDDLTAATGSANFGDSLAAYVFEAQRTQHVIYGDDNYPIHLHELWWDPTGWHSDDLTAATGAPPGAGSCRAHGAPCTGLPAYAFEAQGTQHVVYVSYVDRHLHELWWGPHAAVAAPTSSATPTTSGGATQIINEVAVDSHGQPINGYHEPSRTSNMTPLDCTESSPAAVSNNIYYCSPTAAGADVCWLAGPASSDLLCMDDPWNKDLHRVRARTPLPAVSPPHLPEPVALLLADGNRCRLRNGGSWSGRPDGYNGAYSCGGGVAVLIARDGATDAVDRSSPTWTVKLGKLSGGEPVPPPDTVSVATAWFASN
jgi:hypothetical protein